MHRCLQIAEIVEMRLLRPIRTADWDRPQIYAPRVKHLSSGADFPMSEVFDMSKVFRALSVSLPRTLFQNLQSLDLQHSADDFHHIQLFLHPRLTKLSLVLSSDSASSLLSTLASKCPRLINVAIDASLSYGGEDPDTGPASDFICGLQNPEELSIPWVGQDALEHLSKSLVLTGPHFLDFATYRFKAQESGQRPIITEDKMHPLFAGIVAGVSHSSLTALVVHREWDVDSDPVSCMVARRSMRLLLCFSNLFITLVHGFDLDDDTAAEMARAWPGVKTLRLKSNHHVRMPRTTAASLYSFAQHCPHLRQLTFAFDGTTVPGRDTARSRTVQHSLRALCVEHSPVTNPISVARFLSGLLPSLDEIETHREYERMTWKICWRTAMRLGTTTGGRSC
ncbi:hypothetical protein C8R47DRAFT_1084350 [Mycena vitilis]|nr:hypothetical protein C8R47DRAFT_1084350 [Mycena vitilis]